MSVLVEGSLAGMCPDDRRMYDKGDLALLLYADDTLVFSVQARHLEEFAAAIAARIRISPRSCPRALV